MTIPDLRFAFRAEVTIGVPLRIGGVDGNNRVVIPITGGSFAGPELNAKVLPGGADWQVIRPDGTADILARYSVQADDGTLFSVINAGYRHGSPEVLARLAKGEAVDVTEYYFRTAPRFEVAADSAHAWLAKTIFVATAERQQELVLIDVFAVE